MYLPLKIASAASIAVLPLVASASPCHTGSSDTQGRFVSAQQENLPSLFEITFTTPTFSTLAGLVAVADLDEALGGGEFTVFAPTNDAFKQLGDATLRTLVDADNRETLAGILTYHVVPGRIALENIPQGTTTVETLAGKLITIERDGNAVTVNGTRVVSPDVFASNGVAHVVEGVLSPEDAPQETGLFDVVEQTDALSTLGRAVTAAGFAHSLDNDGPYTVFAPTNDAFRDLPTGTLDTLLEHHNVEDLRSVLRLHIVAGAVDARSAVVAGEAESRQGGTLRFEIE
ncbi:MAG: fasciclin domain-containing protein, partial [Planctomycetota bacterium]